MNKAVFKLFVFSGRLGRYYRKGLFGFALIALFGGSALAQTANSSTVTNPIVAENLLAGSPPSQWQIKDAGDPTIQGFATDISVNKGGTIYFKISTPASAYTIKIFRLGYYQGNGARLIASVTPSAHLPQTQPAPITDPSTGLIDCGNWAVSASWQVPTNAVSGVYIARLTRTDTGGASQITFIVRDDASTSDIIFKTSDETWQAYNAYGGNSLYVGSPVGRAYKVSYNRPFFTASPTAGGTSGNTEHDWLYNGEYPMIRWLEANGFNVTYTSGLDMDRQPGSLLLQHHLMISCNHDEYWSGLERTNVENALAAGMSLAFFSGNEVSWKVRWETSIDGSNTPYRTMVCYKESLANAKIDPSATWTGYFRDPRFSSTTDGRQPENRLTGTLSVVNDSGASYTILVPAQYAANRFWRNTSIASLAPGTTGNLGGGTLGYEWDVAPDNGYRPPGLMFLSSTTETNMPVLQGDGIDYENTTATHNLTLYRAPSGALVFGAGTCQWSWGLDTNHYDSYSTASPPASLAMQQATVNLFADMGIQPGSLKSGLVATTASTDITPPTVSLAAPTSGGTIALGTPMIISGTASDVGGVVAGVEVSTDGGNNWHAASGTANWSYTWLSQQAGSATILCRAVDDSGNLCAAVTGPVYTVTGSVGTLWPNTATPTIADMGTDAPVELGMKFQSDVSGYITGLRFYKAMANKGTHIANLWSRTGTRLATATFTGESASGWQQVNFATPVAIMSNTLYVASYHSTGGHYSEDDNYFQAQGVDAAPLHAPSSILAGQAGGQGVGNGLYAYGSSSAFPSNTWEAANFWVDVVFATNTVLPVITTTLLPGGMAYSSYSATLTASEGKTPYTWSISAGTLPPGLSLNAASGIISGTATNSGTFSFTAKVTDASSPVKTATAALSITVTPASSVVTLWPSSAAPVVADQGADTPVELGVKFRSDVAGSISGIRFYKAAANTGTHVGDLWSTNGTLLASATFTGETASGWQQVNFSPPVAISSNVLYVASYHCNNGHYSEDDNYFAASGVDNPPLHALANTVSANGVYAYGTGSTFPNQSFSAANYWVDAILVPVSGPVLPDQTNRVINELTTLTVTNTATELGTLPGSALSYTLTVVSTVVTGSGETQNNIVTNSVISTNGIITWTPAQTQSPSTNVFTTVVSNGNTSATNAFIVIVMEANQPPLLPAQTNLSLTGTQPITVTNTATEPNIHSLTTGYGLIVAPAGAVIDTNGIITWTPTGNQVPSTNTFTTVVTNANPYDLVNPGLKATNSFVVTVLAFHNGPSLPTQNNVINNELVLLTVTNTATDSDLPAPPLTYSLFITNLNSGLAVTNAAISTNGVIAWTPQQTQSPSTNQFTTIVSDGSLKATNAFNVIVREVNQAPVLPAQGNLSLSGTQPLTVTNTATEPNLHSVTTGYHLLVAPAGAVIDTNGVISWTPAVNQVPSTNTFATVVTNTNLYDLANLSLTTTNSFVVTVLAIHNGPSLPVQDNVTNNELVPLTVTNTAADSDIPALPLTYSLVVTNLGTSLAVTNAVIDTNGVIIWTPAQTQSPGTNQFTTIVSDGSLKATNAFNVIVREVNQAPVLPAQSNLSLSGTQPLTVTNTATEPNIHSVTTGYRLLVSPIGASIDTNGVIAWTPAVNQVPSTNTFTTVVTNNNPYDLVNPTLTATNAFVVTVLAIHNGPALPVQNNVTNNELVLLTVTNTATDNDIPALPLTYSLFVTNLNTGLAVTNAVITTNGVIIWTPAQTQSPSTNRFITIVTDGSLSATNAFNVFVREVNQTPVLPSQTNLSLTGTQPLTVTNTASEPNLHSITTGYGLLVAPIGAAIDTNGIVSWIPAANQVPSTNTFTTVVTNNNPFDLVNPSLTATNSFLVTVSILPQPVIQSIGITNGIVTLSWSAVPDHVYQLQYIDDLSSTNWTVITPNVTASSNAAVTTDVIGISTQRFYRIMVVQ